MVDGALVPTPLAIVTFGRGGEPAFQVYGAGIAATMRAGGAFLEEAHRGGERPDLRLQHPGRGARAAADHRGPQAGPRARAAGPLRPQPAAQPLGEHGRAIGFCRELCDGAFLVRANRSEAEQLTGASDPESAASALCGLGARLGVVTMGAEGAVIRGAAEGRQAPRGRGRRPARSRGRFHGPLAAELARLGWDSRVGRPKRCRPRLGPGRAPGGWARNERAGLAASPRRRVRAIRDRLREMYGRRVNGPTATRSTSWSGPSSPRTPTTATATGPSPAFGSASPPGRRSATRRPTRSRRRSARAGSARQKAPRIQEILARARRAPGPRLARDGAARGGDGLPHRLPGVGRKTAACVLIFTWGIPEIPVDVHVYRVGGRLGLFRPNASFEEAHDEMLAITDPDDAYELHMNLIRHGREVCRPKPRCGECELRRMCPWYREHA